MSPFDVSPPPPDWREVINRRRGPSPSVPLLPFAKSLTLLDELFARHGLEDEVGSVTAEMRKRPIPHVFPLDKVRPLIDLCRSWYPLIMARALPAIKPPLQALNATSRLGWPEFKHTLDKRGDVLKFFGELQNGVEARLRGCYTIMNVRLQDEPKQKERDFLFIDKKGRVYEQTITAQDRMISMRSGTQRMASRTRLVFNLAIANLVKQALDTAIHKYWLTFPLFGHNLYANSGREEIPGTAVAFDVKHFERHTAAVCRLRAEIIGGNYGLCAITMMDAPFLVPNDEWNGAFLIRVRRDLGWSEQFASGSSEVAPAQKEIMLILFSEFFHRTRGLTREAAIELALAGGPPDLRIKNYGDDNCMFGDKQSALQLLSFLQGYLDAEEEIPPKFLGFERSTTEQRWILPLASYLRKTYLNERRPGSNFRPYPCFGWIKKRSVYGEYGPKNMAATFYPEEDEALAAHGLPWSAVIQQASVEEQIIEKGGTRLGLERLSWMLDKYHLLSEEDKLATGLFQGLSQQESGLIIKWLLPTEWRAKLSW